MVTVACCALLASDVGGEPNRAEETSEVSPARKIDRGDPPGRESLDRRVKGDRSGRSVGIRDIDGRNNNAIDPEMGAAGSRLLRLVPPAYADEISALADNARPSARAISNAVSAQPTGVSTNPLGASDFLWQWGQFLDHDIDLTDGVDPPEPAPIAVPTGDVFFDPDASGDDVIAFNRSIYDPATGTAVGNPRQQLNEITAWIDASNVYGSDDERAHALRTLDGTGRLKQSAGGLLPFNEAGLPNAGGSGAELFLAGDVRANEQVGLAAMHTLFVREHNRLAESIAARSPGKSGEEIYQEARRLVGALMQIITYEEFLPALLGPRALPSYRGYDDEVNAQIANAFSTAAYRFGHSALSPTLLRLDASGEVIAEGNLALRDAFFRPDRIINEGGIEPLLRGLAAQPCQAIDAFVIDDVRNFLFGPPGAGGFDLAALNVQRGRDHGLPGYNEVRAQLGLRRAATFAEISSDPETQQRLASAYATPDDIDLWVGGLSEDREPGGHLGPLFTAILVDQFTALRDGDRFWYERDLSRRELDRVRGTRLSDVIRRNTDIRGEIQDNVFLVTGNRRTGSENRGHRR